VTSSPVNAPSREPWELTLDRFTPHVGSRFLVLAGTALPTVVTLDEAVARPPRPSDPSGLGGEAFSLVFVGRNLRPLGQRSSTVVHPALGRFPLHLSPIGPSGKVQEYEAVVDRRAPTP